MPVIGTTLVFAIATLPRQGGVTFNTPPPHRFKVCTSRTLDVLGIRVYVDCAVRNLWMS